MGKLGQKPAHCAQYVCYGLLERAIDLWVIAFPPSALIKSLCLTLCVCLCVRVCACVRA